MLGASRVEQLSVGFIRVIGMIVLAITAVISVWCVQSGQFGGDAAHVAAGAASMMTALSAALVILLVPMLPGKGSLFRVVASIGALSGVAAAWLWSWGVTEGVARNWLIEALGGLGQLLGAFLIGSVTVAWLLGHAYLTATKMTIAPLRRLSTLFCIAVGLRFAYAMLCMLILWLGPQWGLENSTTVSLGGSWLILSLRVGVGLLAVGVFAYMVADCVKLRSTQSATGILYFAAVFAYIGELSSQHLMTEFGLPL